MVQGAVYIDEDIKAIYLTSKHKVAKNSYESK